HAAGRNPLGTAAPADGAAGAGGRDGTFARALRRLPAHGGVFSRAAANAIGAGDAARELRAAPARIADAARIGAAARRRWATAEAPPTIPWSRPSGPKGVALGNRPALLRARTWRWSWTTLNARTPSKWPCFGTAWSPTFCIRPTTR